MKKTTLFVALASLALVSAAYAEETMGEKVQDSASEAKKDTKKSVRKAKKSVRDATGHGSVSEDIKDAGNNAGDSLEHGTKKIKNKVD